MLWVLCQLCSFWCSQYWFLVWVTWLIIHGGILLWQQLAARTMHAFTLLGIIRCLLILISEVYSTRFSHLWSRGCQGKSEVDKSRYKKGRGKYKVCIGDRVSFQTHFMLQKFDGGTSLLRACTKVVVHLLFIVFETVLTDNLLRS